ncbi:MAG TPA: M67 family metallopeptidase [Candidatus Dormibacteraeota bacterium]|nr:M67 family metallopeptidase [Candidatus Dormibacteraeota bacterium]
MNTLEISAELAEEIREQGAAHYPDECCGALLGRESAANNSVGLKRQILGLVPLVNRRDDSPRDRFSITAEDVLSAEKMARLQGLEVLGWYHSHPDHEARPSEYDREHAWPWYSYVIVSVNAGVAAEMTCWRLRDDRAQFSPEGIKIGQRAAA